MSVPWRRPAAALAVGLAVLSGGCVSEPTRLPLGATRAQALQQLGAPTATYALAGGASGCNIRGRRPASRSATSTWTPPGA